MKYLLHLICTLLFIFPFGVYAQNIAEVEAAVGYNATNIEPRNDPAMNKWRYNRFGQFFHIGLYTTFGAEYDGQQAKAGEWLKSEFKLSDEVYNKALNEFNPFKFNASDWAKIDKTMGTKYMIITAKHHEGFCLWPSKFTDFTIKNTPYKKDMLGPLFEAYNSYGIDVFFYYSILDWNHPDYRAIISSPEDKVAMERYIGFVIKQLDELLTLYPQLTGLWFDGQWDTAYKSNPEWGWKIEEFLRKKKPNIIINNRLRSDVNGKLDRDKSDKHYGDFDASFEQKMPDPLTKYLNTDWETSSTLMNNGWSYSKKWQGEIKTSKSIVENLVKATSANGNFVLNFAPTPEGSISEYETKISKEIGSWMSKNNKAIYGCGAINLPKPSWGYYTQSKEKVYMIMFQKPSSKLIQLPFQSEKIKSVKLLNNDNIKLSRSKSKDGTLIIDLTELNQDNIANVIELQF